MIIPFLMFLAYSTGVLVDNTNDYQECKTQKFEGFAKDNFAKCENLKGLYEYDKDSKSVKKGK